MEAGTSHAHPAALSALRVLRRSWWIVLGATAVVAALMVALSMRQDPLYQASSRVLLKYENLASGITGIQDVSGVYQDPARIAETQTEVAMSPPVAAQVAARAGIPGLTAAAALGAVSVKAEPSSDVLEFRASWGEPAGAVVLATKHARQYVQYRKRLDTAALLTARRELRGRIDELRAEGLQKSPLYEKLVENEQQLRTMEALQTANASVLREPTAAVQVQPRVERNAVLGVVLGLMLGVALAFVRNALDTRVTTAAEIGDVLGLTVLARIASPSRKGSGKRLVMLSHRLGVRAEAYRMLRTNLDFVNIDAGARTIMFTSAHPEEGKSTTIANLGIALMRAGKRVAVVDLDLRRPTIADLFGIERDEESGVTTVLLGREQLADALRPVLGGELDFGGGSNGHSPLPAPGDESGVLTLLPSGPLPPDPGEFITNSRLRSLLEELAETFDVVLVDSPPILKVGDAMVLSANVDAMVAVSRLGMVKRPALVELRKAIETCPTLKLGCVVTGAEAEEGYGHPYGDEYAYGDERAKRPARVEEARV